MKIISQPGKQGYWMTITSNLMYNLLHNIIIDNILETVLHAINL